MQLTDTATRATALLITRIRGGRVNDTPGVRVFERLLYASHTV